MIIVAELAFNDGGHVPFNAGLLAVVRTAFPGEQVCFFGGSGHIGELKKQMGEGLAESIEWKEMKLLLPDVSYWSRLLGERKILRSLLPMFPEGSTGPLLLLTSARPATLVALKWVRCNRYRNIRAQVVLHGHLSGVAGKRYRHPVRRFQEMRTALTLLGNGKLQYLVLEESLRDVLVQHMPALAGKVEVLEHPLPPNEAETKPNHLSTPIQFGFLGLANEAKGFPAFVKLAEDMTVKFQEKAEFHAIGRVSPDEKLSWRTDALTTKPGAERLSRADYIQGVDRLHFIVLPHHASFYDLNSSGTLLDSLAWSKPLIARKIAIFENFFAEHGDVGYLFGTDRELEEIVEHILGKADKLHYDEQVRNIQKARCSRAPETLAGEYRNLCEKMRDSVQ